MAIVIKPPLFPRHPCREAIPLHMVCQDLYSVFKVLSFGTIILYQTFSDLSRGLSKIFLGNFYQSLNLKEVCIIVVRPPGVEPGWPLSQRILSPLCSYQFHHGSINGTPGGTWTHTSFDNRVWADRVCQFRHQSISGIFKRNPSNLFSNLKKF